MNSQDEPKLYPWLAQGVTQPAAESEQDSAQDDLGSMAMKQIGTRIPASVHKRLKSVCVDKDMHIQDAFLEAVIAWLEVQE